MGASAPERPRVDHPVDRPELYGLRGLEVTGTNGRSLDRFYRRPSVASCQWRVASGRPASRRVRRQERDQVNLTYEDKKLFDRGGLCELQNTTLNLRFTKRPGRSEHG